tara:strand:+ start:2592 stop:4343 length:1752 start_codon:yes stop_codon:yes gene_type:complete
MKLSDYVIKFLEEKGIKHAFAISGGGCMHLIDSLGKSDIIDYVCNHHEQASAMAAEGYYRMSGKVAACIVTTGPGGTNTLTGVMGAWTDSIPVIFISGQVQRHQLSEGTGCRQVGDQEFDIVSIMKNTTKFATRVDDENNIRYILEKAHSIATTGRPGPVWIDIPLDIQPKEIDTSSLKEYQDNYVSPSPSIVDTHNIVDLLLRSKKPVLVLGSGIRLSGAEEILFSFLDKFKIPVVTGPHSAVDIVNETYEHYCGRIGVLGQRSSNKIIQNCDLMISIGSRLGVKMTGYKYEAFAKNAYKIMVDIDENEMNKYNIHVDLKVKSDCFNFLEALMGSANLLHDDLFNIKDWHSYCKDLRSKEQYVFDKHRNYKGYASNYCFVEGLSELVPENVPTITSNGSAHVITLQTMSLSGKQRLFTNVGCASMGYGLPAAIGACVSNNNSKTICIEGDGSLQMNIQELQTVVHHALPMIIFVINNGLYLSIKRTQENYFNSRYVATSIDSGISSPDLKKIADAYGIEYISINNNSQIHDGIKHCLETTKPIICEVFTNPDEKHEPKVTAVLNEDGSFSPGELTDMKIEGV